MDVHNQLSSEELKRQIEALKKEVARKEKKLKCLERVAKNRSSTPIVHCLKRKHDDFLKKQSLNREISGSEKDKSQTVDGDLYNSKEHFRSIEYGYMHNKNTFQDKLSPSMIADTESIDYKEDLKSETDDVCNSSSFNKICPYNKNTVEQDKSSFKMSTDINAFIKPCIESSQTEQSNFPEQSIQLVETSISNELDLCRNSPSCQSMKLECEQYCKLFTDQINFTSYSTNQIYSDTASNALPTSDIASNKTEESSGSCLKDLFSILGEKVRNLSNSDFTLPEVEYGLLKLKIISEKSYNETQSICDQKKLSPVTKNSKDYNQDATVFRTVSEMSTENGDKEFHDKCSYKPLVPESSSRFEKNKGNTICANGLDVKSIESKRSTLYLPSSTSEGENGYSAISSASPCDNSMKRTLPSGTRIEDMMTSNNMSSLLEEGSQVKNKNDVVKENSMQLLFILKADSSESVKKISSYIIPQEEEQYILIQHITKVSIWTQRDLTWLHNSTFSADIDEKVFDSCLLHQKSSLYFAVVLRHIDGCVLHIFTFNPKLKTLEKLYSQTNIFQRMNLCISDDKIIAVAYSVPNTSIIYLYKIQENVNDKCNTCIPHLLANINDYITMFLMVDNLPHALLCCGEQNIYIWNELTCKLTCKICMGKEISTRSCYAAYALKGLLFLIMMKHPEQEMEPCLIALNPVTSKYKVLRTYGSLKEHHVHTRSISAKHYISILDDCKLTIYNFFTAQEIASMKECKGASVSASNKASIIMVGFDNGTTHCYLLM